MTQNDGLFNPETVPGWFEPSQKLFRGGLFHPETVPGWLDPSRALLRALQPRLTTYFDSGLARINQMRRAMLQRQQDAAAEQQCRALV